MNSIYVIKDKYLCHALTKLRVSSHKLMIYVCLIFKYLFDEFYLIGTKRQL